MEALSPELALIDPELARRSLESSAVPYFAVVRSPPPRSPARQSKARSRSRSETALLVGLLMSLAVNGALVGRMTIRSDQPSTVAKPTMLTTAGVTHGTAAVLNRRAVEQRLLAVLVERPKGKLPSALIDPLTGLAKSNLQARCRTVSSGVVSCFVRPAVHRPGEGLPVSYSASAGFTWWPYRSGVRPAQAHRPRPRPARHHA